MGASCSGLYEVKAKSMGPILQLICETEYNMVLHVCGSLWYYACVEVQLLKFDAILMWLGPGTGTPVGLF